MELPYAPVAEALFEIRFTTADRQPLSATAGQLLHDVVRDRFPRLEIVSDNHVNVQYRADSGQVQANVAPPGRRMLFKSATAHELLQLTQGAFTVNVLAPYRGWAHMRALIERVWADASALLGLRLGTRLTLRYINKIRRAKSTLAVGAWLKDSPYISSAILPATDGFYSAVHVQDEAKNMHTGVTVNTFQTSSEDTSIAPILFDVVVFVDLSFALPINSLSVLMERLQHQAQKVVAASVTQRALQKWS